MRAVQYESIKGISFVTLGLFLFSIQDVIIRSFSDKYPVLQIGFYRSITGICIMLVILLVMYPPESRKLHLAWPVWVKGFCAFLSYTSYYLAIAVLPLADVATITFSQPIMVTAASALLFRDRVGIRRWIGVLLGFFAIVLVVGPKGHFNNLAVVLALFAAFTYAVSTIMTRYMHPKDEATIAAFYTVLIYLIGTIVITAGLVAFDLHPGDLAPEFDFLLRDWIMPGHLDQWILLFLGIIATAGFFCLVKAYMVAEFSAVAPFEYSYIFWGALFGYLIWDEIPTLTTATGIILLIGSNLYILSREVKHKKRVAFRRPKIPKR